MTSLTAPIVDPVLLMRDEAVRTLDGLTDAEYLWEPGPGTWSVRPRAQARVAEVAGSGDWVLEFPSESPDPPPPTSIAWRMAHLYLLNSVYAEILFGDGRRGFDDFPIASTAAAARAAWQECVDAFVTGISTLSLDDFHRSVEMPWGEETTVRGWTEWFTLHNTHHIAEVGCVRDFHRLAGD